MGAIKSNKLAMYRAVLALLKSPAAPLGGSAALAAKLTAFTNKVVEITALANMQAQPTSGVVADRNQLLRLVKGSCVETVD